MNLYLKKATFFPLIVILFPTIVFAQTGVNTNGSSTTAPTTAVPFLLISPDSRSGALGDAGVALSPDVNANYWNPAKLAFLENNDDVSISYSPWLRQLGPDVSLSYLSYAHVINSRDAFGLSLRYFNFGSTTLSDVNSNYQGTYYPNEYSLNASFARKFGEGFSLGVTASYIRSNFSDAAFSSGAGQSTQAASNAASVGVSLYYKSQFQQFGKDATFAFGTNISNIGTKISYANDGNKYFLPANLKIGAANTINLDDYNQLTLTLDLNKLLVPTSANTNNVSVVSGIFNSFSDNGNEFQQLTFSPGLEYWYNHTFALRVGYFYESENYGGSTYLTTGVGFQYDTFKFDFSYLAAAQQNSPLANTLRFTLTANLGGSAKTTK
jgi:hypothetical protein